MKSLSKNNKGFTLIEVLVVIFLLVSLGTVAINSYIRADASYQFVSNYKNAISTLRTGRLYAFTNHEIADLDFENYGVYLNKYCIILFADSGNNKLQFDPNPSAILAENCLNLSAEVAEEENDVSNAGVVAFNKNSYFFDNYSLTETITANVFSNFLIASTEAPPSFSLQLNQDSSSTEAPPGVFMQLNEGSNYDSIIQTKKFIFDEMDYYFDVADVDMPLSIFYELSTGKVQIFDKNGALSNKSLEINFMAEENELSKSILFFKYSGLSEESY